MALAFLELQLGYYAVIMTLFYLVPQKQLAVRCCVERIGLILRTERRQLLELIVQVPLSLVALSLESDPSSVYFKALLRPDKHFLLELSPLRVIRKKELAENCVQFMTKETGIFHNFSKFLYLIDLIR